MEEVVYTSVLSPGVSAAQVATLVRRSREYNSHHDITGILIFDGARFCQYLEGPEQAVRSLLERIAVDPRHQDYRLCHQGPLPGQRRYRNWSLAYALDDESVLEQLPTVPPAAMAQFLIDNLLKLDLEPGLSL